MSQAGGLAESFEERLTSVNLAGARLGYLLSALLMPAGAVLDWAVYPERFVDFLWIRCSAALAALALLGASYLPGLRNRATLLGAGPPLVCASGIELMVLELGGHASPYYAGLNLCILAVGVLYTWQWRQALVVSGAVVSLWLVPAALQARTPDFDRQAFLNNLYFLSLTAVIAVASAVVRYNAARREYQAHADLGKASSELAGALDQLREMDRFKSEFFANVTHELKTPLTMILAPLELMLQGDMGRFTEAQRASIESMLRNGTKLLKLIGDLLDLSKLDESRLRLQVAEHDLVPYLRELVDQVQPLAQRKSIALTFEHDVASSKAHCDLERLERVFVNLIANAAKFTPQGGRIGVTLRDLGAEVEVAVADSGVGFPPEMASRIFERFFQVDPAATRKFGGTGIGLALAKELVLLHGGRICAESGEAGGATFTVTLVKDREHFHPDQLDRRGRREDRIAGSRAGDHGIGEWQVQATGKYRFIDIDEATDQRVLERDLDEHERAQSVLVVEDTPDVIRVIHLALRNHFRVLAAPGGAKGLELAAKHLPNLVITDLMMPEMDGMELTRRLRGDPGTRHIPIVMLTARGEIEDRVAGLEAGVNAYLAKPFSVKELVSTVRGLVTIQETAAEILLRENMDALETIAGGLAHEINNPLNYVKNSLVLIREDAEGLLRVARERAEPALVDKHAERALRMFDVAESGLKRIGATVDLMRRYARDGYARVLQPMDVFESARDVVAMLQLGRAEKVIETSFEGDGQAECVPEELHQVLTNLVQNALDAISPQGGRVWVRGRGEEDAVVLVVADNGSGIAAADRGRIFAPFYTTKDVGAGMGLGLTIVHRVVASLGGTVSVTSEPGAGAEFTVRLLRRRGPAAVRRGPGLDGLG